MSRISELIASERPRERCLRKGAQSLSLRECLAVLLGSGPRGQGCLGLAKNLLERLAPGLSDLDQETAFFHALENEGSDLIKGISGFGDASRARILAALELSKRYSSFRESRKRASESLDWDELAKAALHRIPPEARNDHREWIGFVPLHRNGALGELCVVNKGATAEVQFEVADFFAAVLALRAAGFFIAHNHPSGTLDPSEADHHLTGKITEIAESLGIRALGHLIVAPGGSTRIDDSIFREIWPKRYQSSARN